jgi:hypothetical protein
MLFLLLILIVLEIPNPRHQIPNKPQEPNGKTKKKKLANFPTIPDLSFPFVIFGF